MIVKNEAPVIQRCVDSLRPIIDYWVIVDTGSTDGTQEIVRRQLKDIPGELHEKTWRDFAHNRSEALELARGRADYVFVIDADEVLEIEPGFAMPRLELDSYNLLVRYGGCSYQRKQLVHNTLPWRYEGVVHEYITCPSAVTEAFLPGLTTVPHHDGARAHDAGTYRRDAQILEKALLDDPGNSRYVFYLAQSYRDAGDLEPALRHYKRRIEMGGWPEEIWYSMYQVAQIRERLQHPWAEVMESYLAAFQYHPDRAGPLYRIAMHYQASREYNISHLYLSRAIRVPRPAPNRLFVEQTIYDFHLLLEYAVACYYVGQHTEAINVNNALLRSSLLPPHMMDQVICNRRFSVDAVHPKPEKPEASSGLRVLVPFRNPGPELDDTVESLRAQQGTFKVVFLDHGSTSDQTRRQALDDSRFSLQRYEGMHTERQLFEHFVKEHCLPTDIIMLLRCGERLAEPGTLKQIREFLEENGCLLAYGQYRTSSGTLGEARPASCEEEFLASNAFLAGASIAFRAELLQTQQSHELTSTESWHGLFSAAGFVRTGFCDAIWTYQIPVFTEAEGPIAGLSRTR